MISGTPTVTLRDIAAEASLSVSAVSMALAGHPEISHATQMRVREIGRRLNYQPRRRRPEPRHGSEAITATRRVGLVLVGYDSEPTNLVALVRHVSGHSVYRKCKLEVAAVPPGEDDRQFEALEEIATGVDGLLINGYVRQAFFDRLNLLGVPSVVLGNVEGDPLRQQAHGYQVSFDMRAMGHLATRTNLRAGHRRVALLSRALRPNLWFDQWHQGYRDAHAEAGVPLDASLISITAESERLHADHLGKLGGDQPPTAYVAANSALAGQAIAALAQLGRPLEPGQMIIGATAEGARHGRLENYPLITADPDRQSRIGFDLLLRALAGPAPEPCRIVVPFTVSNWPAATSLSEAP